MKNSQFEAKTFGVGQLIAQRKLFRVPLHQRSYAWEKDSVEEFLGDVETSLSRRDSDYFIGLVVIQAAPGGEWILLDGQQRLTTVSLIYAAVRNWLHKKGFDDDARQIDHEFIGMRRLGGDYSSRMLLNSENAGVFSSAIAEGVKDFQLEEIKRGLARPSSNAKLVSAALLCRSWIDDLVAGVNEEQAAETVYALAEFLETRLKVVAVEVSDDVDAYVLFESLNDRGVALSALDLIKNYIFSKAPEEADNWHDLLSEISDQSPDDFLKVFWTSRRGLISKSQIFKGVKESYQTRADVQELLRQMLLDAKILSALSDTNSSFWDEYPADVRDLVYLLRSLDSKQARSVLVAIFREIREHATIRHFVWMISVALVRFQLIGKGRTGVVEKVFGRLCELISRGGAISQLRFQQSIAELFIDDEQFSDAFRKHRDKKLVRVGTLLAIDAAGVERDGRWVVDFGEARAYLDNCRPVLYVKSALGDQHPSEAPILGAYHLVRVSQESSIQVPAFGLSLSDSPIDEFIEKRTDLLSQRAAKIWRVEAGE